MKIKTTTIILAFVALGAIGLVFALEQRPQISNREKVDSGTLLYSFKEDDAQAIEIQTATGEKLSFERTNQTFPNTWAMKKPEQVVADEAAIAFLLDQLSSSKSQRNLEVPLTQKQDFGFKEQNSTATIKLKNRQSHHVILGGETFDKKGVYALVDPSNPLPNSLKVSIISTTLVDAIERPLQEWKYNPASLPSRNSSDESN